MRNEDEFEDLIRNFKLDDVEDSGDKPNPPQGYTKFDVDDDRAPFMDEPFDDEPMRAFVPHRETREPGSARAQSAARNITSRSTARDGGASRTRPRGRADTGGEPSKDKKDQFKVNIQDDGFYGYAGNPLAPNPPVPPYKGRDDRDDGYDGGSGGGGRWVKALIVLAIALGISVFLAFFALSSASDMFGMNKPDAEIEFTLPENLSMADVAEQLGDAGVITQPLIFRIYAGLKAEAEQFRSGTYMLNSNLSYDQIIVMFKNHSIPKVEVTLMFPEGSTLLEMAKKLEEGKVCTQEDLFEFLNNGEMSYDYEFFKSVPSDPLRFQQYEGYFFPDTYQFYQYDDVETVVQKFFRRFQEVIDTEEIKELLAASEMPLDDVIKLASITQKEAGKPEDMEMVSSVFHNRLKNPEIMPRLESDVTVFYVENDIKPFMSTPNQPMYDAYNTRVSPGLPVGPICNPGIDAIKATLKYPPSSYFYFLADKEGKFYYANTLEQHNANIYAAGITGVHGIEIPAETAE